MKRIVFIFLLIIVFLRANSQVIVGSNVQSINCNYSNGYISVTTDFTPSFYSWYFFDDSLSSWVGYLSGSSVDSISFSNCGDYRLIIYDSQYVPSDTVDYFTTCPMNTLVNAHQNILCYGDSTGMLKQVVTGGNPFDPDGVLNSGDEYYIYSWYRGGSLLSSGQNDTLITNLIAGEYYVNVLDADSCIYHPIDSSTGLLDTSVIFQPNLLRIDSLVIDTVHCRGTNTGSFYINVKDGKRYISEYYNYYLIDSANDTIRWINRNGSSLNTVSVTTPYFVYFDSLPSGYFTLSIVDSFACVLDTQILIPEPELYSFVVDINPSIVCEHDSTWLKIVEVNGGYSSIVYNWLSYNYLDSIYVRSGTYQIVIYDTIFKCEDTLDYTLTAPNTIYVDIESIPAFCYGTNTGRISIDSIFGGVSPYNVQWGGVNPDSLHSGIYTVYITDSLGCVYLEDIFVDQQEDVSVNASTYPPSCFGYSDGSIAINLIGGNHPLSYNWTSGSGSPDSLFSIPEGIYVLSIIDSLGCQYIDSITLTQPDSIEIIFSGYTNPLLCNGGVTLINANVNGGTGAYSLFWNTPNLDTNYQVVVPAGSYVLNVSDINGCMSQKTIIINEPDSLSIQGSFVQATCNIGGSASINYIGGTEPMSYIWSNGETTSTVDNLNGGDHWVIVTDSCGDTASFHFTINDYILETDLDHYNNPVNFAEVIVVNSTAGGPFTYQWYDEDMNIMNGETNFEIFNLCEGWYFVNTIDINSCEVMDSVYSTLYFPMGGIVDESTTTVYDDNLLWGSAPYTYLWDNGDITPHGNICAGLHKVWVTDVNGCEVVGEVIVNPIELNLSPSDLIIECDITNLDVELEVIASGGIGTYSFLWNNGESMNPISISLFPGLYSVQVTDENFCSVDTIFQIARMTSDCIPNVFSPNNDGVNDVWSLEDAFLYLDTEVKIYGRYGNLVFKSIGYSSPWDGKNQRGNDVEDGAYFYVIDFGKGIDKIKGTVSVIR